MFLLILLLASGGTRFAYAQGSTEVTYTVSLSGTSKIYGAGTVKWEAYATLIVYYGEGSKLRLRLNVNYISPSISGLYDIIKPQLEQFLYILREAIEFSSEKGSPLSNKLVIPYYSESTSSMMKCIAYFKSEYHLDGENISILMPKGSYLPAYMIFSGNIGGKAMLSSASGLVCGSPLVSRNLKKIMLYSTLGILLAAIFSFIAFRYRYSKNFYWRT